MTTALRSTSVTAFPRLHLGLIDLGDATRRRFGGLGLAIGGPATRVTATATAGSSQVKLTHDQDLGVAPYLRSVLDRMAQAGLQAEVTVHSYPPPHVGLGSKTVLAMTMAYAIASAHNAHCDLSSLVRWTGRGGTSGIGVNTFFTGGVVVDGGHPVPPPQSCFTPSASKLNTELPPIVSRADPPSGWVVDLALPDGTRSTGDAEEAFFRANTPIPRDEVLNSLALCYHGVVPAVLGGDLPEFAHAIQAMNGTGFKAREIAAQPNSQEIIRKVWLKLPNNPCGLSSLGPLIYLVREQGDINSRDCFGVLAAAHGAKRLGTVAVRAIGDGATIDRVS